MVYNYFFKPEINVDPVTSEGTSRAGELAIDKEILTLLGDLNSLVLDGSIFNSNAFKSLQDFSLPVEDEPKGRTNPFAPIGVNIVTPALETKDKESQTAPPAKGAFPKDFLEEDIVF